MSINAIADALVLALSDELADSFDVDEKVARRRLMSVVRALSQATDGDMRKILYSPGYGGGWATWAGSLSRDQIVFMLTYPPFIAHLEAEGEFKETDRTRQLHLMAAHAREGQLQAVDPLANWEGNELVAQFHRDWVAEFDEGSFPFLGALRDLKVQEVPAGHLFSISEYDGFERVELFGGHDGGDLYYID